jgi:DNA-binding SARP family transcriptional activator
MMSRQFSGARFRTRMRSSQTDRPRRATAGAPVHGGRLAKLTRPFVPREYQRVRLSRLLDRARRSHAAVWIAAPAGSGKTTAVGTYAASRKLHCLWYQVDAGDADAASLFHHLGLAAAQAAPRFRRPLPKLTPEYHADVDTFTRNYFRELFRRLREPFLIVFDNVQEAAASRFGEIVSAGLREMPRGGCAVLISRSGPPEAFARMRVNHELAEIGWAELRLNARESEAVVRSILEKGRAMTAAEAQALHRRCEGWIAGLILLLRSSAGVRGRMALVDASLEKPQALFDYFAAELFGRWDAASRDFLVQTALLPGFTVEMAERVTADPRCRARLDDLVQRHHFTERRRESVDVYQYHPLFREFLIEHGRAMWSASEATRHRDRAARVLEDAGQPEQALMLYLELEDTSAAARLILANAADLARAGRLDMLDSAIARLPSDVLEAQPWLLYWAGGCRMIRDIPGSRRCLERAFDLFTAKDDRTGILLTVAQIVDTYFYEQAAFAPLDRWIAILDDLVADGAVPPQAETQVATAMFSALMFRQPERPDIDRWVDRVFAAMLAETDLQQQMLLGYRLLFYYTCWRGDLLKARIVVDTLRPGPASREVSPFARIAWNAIESFYSWIFGDAERGLDCASAGLAAAAESGIRMWDVMLFATAMGSALGANRMKEADALLARMAGAVVPAQTFNCCMYQDIVAITALWRHDPTRAREQARISGALAEQSGTSFAQALCGLTRALAEGECGDHEAALTHLRAAHARGSAMGSRYIECLCLFAEARLALARDGDQPATIASLRRAMAAGREGRFFQHLWMPPDVMASLCAAALAHGIDVEYARELIRRRRLTPSDSGASLEYWPFRVKVFTLGSFRVEVDDAPIRFATKTQKKPLELLQVLIALGGREVSEELVNDALWAGADADRASLALTSTVHRLRKLIGSDAIEHRGGGLTINRQHCWIDVWALERWIDDADRAMRSGRTDAVLDSLDRLSDLYGDAFLRHSREQPCVIAARERFSSQLLRILRSASRMLVQSGRHEHAVRCLDKALDVDPLVEETYLALMQSQVTLDRRADALAVYDRCRRALADGLGTLPSPAVETMRRRAANP